MAESVNGNLDYTDFDVQTYLKASYTDPRAPSPNFCPEMRHFLMSRIHTFYNEALPKQTPTTRKLLEFGGGPVLAYIISAVPHVAEIVFSDYFSGNLDAIEEWRNDLPTAHDWTPFFRYVVRDLERNSDPSHPTKRAEQLREKLSAFVYGDANAGHPIGSGYQAYFDVLSISFCFESACRTHADVVKCLRNLAQYLKPGSWIRINGVRGGSHYHVDGRRFFNLTQTEETIRESLTKAGFLNVRVESLDNVIMPKNADYKGMYHATAQLCEKLREPDA